MAKKIPKGNIFAKNVATYAGPTVGMFKTVGKLGLSAAKTVLKHPYIALGATLASKGFRAKGKYAKGRKFNQFGTAGKAFSTKMNNNDSNIILFSSIRCSMPMFEGMMPLEE